MTLDVRPLSPALGAEIRGVDLRREQPAAVVEAIRAAWDRYAVLLFRDQELEIDDQRRFVRYLGEVQPSHTPAERKHPDIMYVGNVTVDGQAGEIPCPEHVNEHVWRPRDLLLWDDRATVHARTDVDPAERRALRRMAIRGDRPVAYRELTRTHA